MAALIQTVICNQFLSAKPQKKPELHRKTARAVYINRFRSTTACFNPDSRRSLGDSFPRPTWATAQLLFRPSKFFRDWAVSDPSKKLTIQQRCAPQIESDTSFPSPSVIRMTVPSRDHLS
jgi:hypothetical protein